MKIISVTHFAPSPPPFGGVSVFVQRLHTKLLKDNFISKIAAPYSYNDTNNHHIYRRPGFPGKLSHFDSIANYISPPNTDILHFHENLYTKSPSIYLLSKKINKIIITIHSPEHCRPHRNLLPWQSYCTNKIIANPNITWIAVSNEIKYILKSINIKGDIYVLPAYIPNEDESLRLPLYIDKFIKSHSKTIFVYANKLTMRNGYDLYGFDQSINAFSSIRKKNPNIGLILLCPDPFNSNGSSRLNQLKELTRQLEIESNVLWILEPFKSLKGILNSATIYLRPTLLDGDSVLIREALAEDCIVLASDAVTRPSGVKTYSLTNLDDMILKLENLLENSEKCLKECNSKQSVYDEITKIYLK